MATVAPEEGEKVVRMAARLLAVSLVMAAPVLVSVAMVKQQ